jgi:hypothetical protein
MRTVQTVGTLLLLIALFGLAGRGDLEEEQRQLDQYCDMVELFKKTNGQSGWPAYDGEEVCK